ncbi:MAG: Bax inhibitor-1/YccA family protein [Acholeplasmataceae bacterium]
MRMRSTNPVFASIEKSNDYVIEGGASYRGITIKTGLFFLVTVLTVFFVHTAIRTGNNLDLVIAGLALSGIVGFVSVIIASFVPRLAMIFGFLYAFAQGFFLGFLTFIADLYAPGTALTALIGTGAVFLVMLFLYRSKTIRVTSRFRKVMITSLFSIVIFMVLFGILNYAGIFAGLQIPFPVLFLINVFLILFAALMLTLDFDRAESIVEGGADSRYEWIVSLGLMITLIWLYVQMIRLIILIVSSRSRS